VNATATTQLPEEGIKSRVDTTLGMIFFIGSWSMAFATVFLAFLVLRARVGVWPPEGIALPSFPLATVATLILIASSVGLHRAIRTWDPLRAGKVSEADKAGAQRAWAFGVGLGVGFAVLQSILWLDLIGAGRVPSSGLYESLFYGLTWFHALHVVAGLTSLMWAWYGLSTGRYGSHRFSTVNNIVIFWHFVDVVWIVLYLGFFVF
jgi:heme/copper-type cytochrome/quinol oxidase subunit 3